MGGASETFLFISMLFTTVMVVLFTILYIFKLWPNVQAIIKIRENSLLLMAMLTILASGITVCVFTTRNEVDLLTNICECIKMVIAVIFFEYLIREGRTGTMYKELATILTPDRGLGGFIVWDDESGDTQVMSPEEMAKKASLGIVDTLAYDETTKSFIPDGRNFSMNGVSKRLLKHIKRSMQGITFKEFVDNDCNFRKQDMKIMNSHDNVILASVSTGFEVRVGCVSSWHLIVAFYSEHGDAIDRLYECFGRYCRKGLSTLKNMRRYGNFILVNVPLVDERSGFSLLELGRMTGTQILFNPEKTRNIVKNTCSIVEKIPFLQRCLLKHMIPEEERARFLLYTLRNINRVACRELGVPFEE